MRKPPRILVVDDQPQNVEILQDRLEGHGYDMATALSGEAALAMAMTEPPDLILLDVVMPGMDGLEVCRRLKADVSLPFIPVIMITAKTDAADIVSGFESGADEYLTKPLEQAALVARVKSMLRLKAFHDRVWEQANQLEAETTSLDRWNQSLTSQMRRQMADLERLSLLKRFVPPPLAECILSEAAPDHLHSKRRNVAILCGVIHGWSGFADGAEPETALTVMSEAYQSIGELIAQFDGLFQPLDGDRLLVALNAPLADSEPLRRATQMAALMRQRLQLLAADWRSRGYPLDVGMGVAYGEATLGVVDAGSHWDYVVMGVVRQLACRLGEMAHGGNMLVNDAIRQGMQERLGDAPAGHLTLPGESDPIPYFEM